MAGNKLATLRDTDYVLTPQGIAKRNLGVYNFIKPLVPIWRNVRKKLL